MRLTRANYERGSEVRYAYVRRLVLFRTSAQRLFSWSSRLSIYWAAEAGDVNEHLLRVWGWGASCWWLYGTLHTDSKVRLRTLCNVKNYSLWVWGEHCGIICWSVNWARLTMRVTTVLFDGAKQKVQTGASVPEGISVEHFLSLSFWRVRLYLGGLKKFGTW